MGSLGRRGKKNPHDRRVLAHVTKKSMPPRKFLLECKTCLPRARSGVRASTTLRARARPSHVRTSPLDGVRLALRVHVPWTPLPKKSKDTNAARLPRLLFFFTSAWIVPHFFIVFGSSAKSHLLMVFGPSSRKVPNPPVARKGHHKSD